MSARRETLNSTGSMSSSGSLLPDDTSSSVGSVVGGYEGIRIIIKQLAKIQQHDRITLKIACE